jgi:hypothetical protein
MFLLFPHRATPFVPNLAAAYLTGRTCPVTIETNLDILRLKEPAHDIVDEAHGNTLLSR